MNERRPDPEALRAHVPTGRWAAGERLVVAVSEQPGSLELVRAAKRIADALGAPWTAVHIETPRSARLSDAENEQLAQALHLATQLGGQVATVPAEKVIDGLMRFTDEARATQFIVGKSPRSRWFELRHGSIVDRLVRGAPGLAVHVLPLGTPAHHARSRRPAGSWGTLRGYLVSLGLTGLVTFVGWALLTAESLTNVGLLYLLPVMVGATRYGVRTGIVTGLASSLAYNFFFIPPTHAFTIQDPQNVITVLVLLGVAVVSSQLAARVREQALLARQSAAQNSALAGFSRLLTGISRREELGQVLCAEIGRLFAANTILLLPEASGLAVKAANPPEGRLDKQEEAAARWAFDNNRPAGRGSDTLTASEWLFQPVAAGGKALGVFGLAGPDARPAIRSDELPLLLSLLDQAGLALERIALVDEIAEIAQLKERDRLRAALLSSVSHDLRTPLTSILGTLAQIHGAVGEADDIAAARSEAERLNRFVANLLDMARIEAGALSQATEPTDLADAVDHALRDMRRALAEHRVGIALPDDLPLLLVDPQLFHHCLINLFDNAAKYAPPRSTITVSARREGGALVVEVLDEGTGIPEGQERRIFDTFARIEGSDRKGGTGLGLAIVKGFAEAMGLEVGATNRRGRSGACFAISFPPDRLREVAPVP